MILLRLFLFLCVDWKMQFKKTHPYYWNMFILENNKMSHFFPNNFFFGYIITCTDFVSGANGEKGFITLREGPLFVFWSHVHFAITWQMVVQ